jgi:hypothetical protein
MSSFIALQDLSAKDTPRTVAFEKSTGGLKLFSERFINVFMHTADYQSSFNVRVITSHGFIVDDKHVLFGAGFMPKVDMKCNSASFNFRLNRSSQNCDKCYFFIVASWITCEGKASFLVSSALSAYTKNAVFGQPNDLCCSYVSTNCFDSEALHWTEDNKLDFHAHLPEIVLFAKRETQQSYIVHQVCPLNLANHRDAVLCAVADITGFQYPQQTSEKSYTDIQFVSQSLEQDGRDKSRQILKTTLSNGESQTSLLESTKLLLFSSKVARSKGQLGKKKSCSNNKLVFLQKINKHTNYIFSIIVIALHRSLLIKRLLIY